ncbi:MAG: hypothetical protein AC479_06835 [miscellaneous Crenarchaeota group-6 archaeon AD8-1]|nr:MAG: hypothetical protein AC479_06835 [miscellaneous Crenarchaeota group-6 archaeon AD8-1]
MIPNEFTLFNQKWSIRTAIPGEMTEDLGQCRPDQLEVVLNHNQSTESIRHTLLHELVHCIEQKLHLEMTERQVDLIALGLIDLFRSNPELLELFEQGE